MEGGRRKDKMWEGTSSTIFPGARVPLERESRDS